MATDREERYWIGFDLGGTKMLAKLFDAEFRPLAQERTKTKGHEGFEAGLKRIAKTIRELLEESDVNPDQVAGIGIGCPGPLDLEQGIILYAPNLGWSDVRIKDHLEEEFDCATVVLNDVDAGVYGEYRFGVAQSARTAVGVFPGTGIGGGCVYEGQIVRGKDSSCMEIGHVQVAPDGPLCGCGQLGCLEALASRLVIATKAAAAAYRGHAPFLMENTGTDVKNIRSGALAASIAAGDTAVENIVRHAARHIGHAVAGVVHLMGPDMVVLGGGLVEAMPDLFVEEVREAARNRVLPTMVDSFQVLAANLGDDAAAMGTAAWAQHVVDAG